MMVHGHHHMTQAKTQYQYVEFNLDDSDWFEMMVHGHGKII